MSLNFGKINRAAAFDPTSAFPLDKRSYFESYNLASAAAQSAKEAGSSESVYYYGQTITVFENNKAKTYIIQPNGILKEIANTDVIPTKVSQLENDSKYVTLPEHSSDLDDVNVELQDIQNRLDNKADSVHPHVYAGEKVTGKQFDISGSQATAKDGAEIFNNYASN
jgi:hypothetical protein